jgi:hypothetical protein
MKSEESMKLEEKELLLRDLCGRLPYQVKVSVNGGKEPWTLRGMFEGDHTGMVLILEPPFPSKDVYPKTSNWQLSQCKPYLRPMESMKLEEYYELEELVRTENSNLNLDDTTARVTIDWFNKNMFDYRGLIPKDLALSTEEYNPYKK